MLTSLVGRGTDEHVEFNYVRDFFRSMWSCRGFESGWEPEASCVPVAAAPAQLGYASPPAVPQSGVEGRCAPGEARSRRLKASAPGVEGRGPVNASTPRLAGGACA